MRYISLFAGIGGFDLALNRLGHVCVWANEWDKYAAEIYNKRLTRQDSVSQERQKEVGNTGNGYNEATRDSGHSVSTPRGKGIDTRDIRAVPTSEIPDHDLLVGGFPCQAFSIAGKRRGFDDTRGTLFFEIARILKDKQPKFFILENVKGLLSHDNGNTFKTIISTLTELGYDLQWQVLNSKNFGVPQNRERVFIVGHIRGTSRPEVFPIGQDDEMVAREICGLQNTQTAIALRATDYKGTHNMIQMVGGSQGYRVYDPVGVSSTLAGEAGGLGAKTGLYAVSSSGRSWGREKRVKVGEANTLSTGKGGDSQSSQNRVIHSARIRRLTPTECERLQGFTDGWTEGISDTQRYKCLGNAVTVNVVYEVARRIK